MNWKTFLNPLRLMRAALPVLGCGTALAQLPATVDLNPEFERLGLIQRHQGSRPTCSVFTMTGALEFALARRQTNTTRLSPEFLNWASNKACNDGADGGFFSDLWKGFEAYGICAETNLPYQPTFNADLTPGNPALSQARTRIGEGLQLRWIKEWNVNTGLTDEHLAAIKKTLASGTPVCGGFRWPVKEEWVEGVLQMRPPEGVVDGHSVLLAGYRDDPSQPGGGVFLIRNSGRGSSGSMPYAYAKAYMNDAVWIEAAPLTNKGAVRRTLL